MDTADRNFLDTAAREHASVSSHLDDLAKALYEGTISRSQALKWLGAGAVAFAIGPLFPEQAEALTREQRRRCRRRGGVPLERGNCNCGETCQSRRSPPCQGNSNCTCYRTTEGRGFCGRIALNPPIFCTSSAQCSPNQRCVVSQLDPVGGGCRRRICLPACP
jgi:hypothetical protein